MKKFILSFSSFLLVISLYSCRETEVNTDGNMEDTETVPQGEVIDVDENAALDDDE